MKLKIFLIALLLIGNSLNGKMMQYFEVGMRNPVAEWNWLTDSDLPIESKTEADKPIKAFLPASPSPANEEVLLSWELRRKAHVTLSISDEPGRLTITNPIGEQQAGVWTKLVTTTALSNGVYYAVLCAGKQQITQKFIVQH